MAVSGQVKLGFISPTSSMAAHLSSFTPLMPTGVLLERVGLGFDRERFYTMEGTLEPTLERIASIVAEKGWDAVIVSGAPFELQNPALPERLHDTLPVPSTTALTACAAALRALDATRVLLMTPFDAGMNGRIQAYLGDRGIWAMTPRETFASPNDAGEIEPDEVRRRTLAALTQADAAEGMVHAHTADAIYFQGAVLDPIKVMDRIEQETELPVVASNPAMLWMILSQLGQRHSIAGYGRLVREWPSPAA